MAEILVVALIGLAVCAAFGYWLLADSDRGASGVVLGLCLGPVGVVVAAILRGQPGRLDGHAAAPRDGASRETSCWNCHRGYDADLAKCPHCGARAPAL